MNKILASTLLVSTLWSAGLAVAETPNDYKYMILDAHSFSSDSCALVERGKLVKKDPIQINGKSHDKGNCAVSLSPHEFSRQFQMCFLVSMRHFNAQSPNCEFHTAGSGKDQLIEFVADTGPAFIESQAMTSCMWACKPANIK